MYYVYIYTTFIKTYKILLILLLCIICCKSELKSVYL